MGEEDPCTQRETNTRTLVYSMIYNCEKQERGSVSLHVEIGVKSTHRTLTQY